jgi:3-oxoacyl-[acyl-carrier-protein] synthase-3
MRNASITGWGKCVPPTVLSNSDVEQLTDTTDDWIMTRTGIKERRISHVETSDLATVAARHALAAAGREAAEIDLLILATCTPDRLIPAAATVVQTKLGMEGGAALDINAACSGFVYALSIADQMIRAGGAERALVIGAEKLHNWLNFTDRSTAVLFGDGAGAVVLEATTEPNVGLRSFELGADGSLGDILCVPGTGTEGSVSSRVDPWVVMDGPEVFKRAVKTMGDASSRVVEKAGLDLDQVDLLVPHQANVRIIDATARRLGLPPEKVFINIASYGNTSAATIPIALSEALDEGRIRPGANLVFAAFGGGLTWAAGVFTWGDRVERLGTSDAALPPYDGTVRDLLQPNIDTFGLGIEPS